MHVKDIRRKNLRALARSVGGVTKLAERLEKAQSQISHLIGTNPIKKIGDKFAAHVERNFSKPHGWLDQNHIGVEEESAPYEAGTARNIPYYIPLLTWQEVEPWLTQPEQLLNKHQPPYVITHIKVSPQTFAVRVESDNMEAPHGISFCNGAIIVVDPEPSAKNGNFVIAKQTATTLVFKQLMIDGSRRYLKPLNPRYPITEITSQTIICGVVKAMVMECK
jgi:SOS-response transcriptional repressor LexA